MEWVGLTIVGSKPDDIVAFATSSWHQAIPLVLIRIPSKLLTSILHAVHIHLDWCQRQHDIVLAHTHVVNHASKRGLVPTLLCLLAIRIDRPHHHVTTPIVAISTRLVRKTNHLPRLRIEFRMRRERGRLDLALEIVPS